MAFDKIFDLKAGVYFNFCNNIIQHDGTTQHIGPHRFTQPQFGGALQSLSPPPQQKRRVLNKLPAGSTPYILINFSMKSLLHHVTGGERVLPLRRVQMKSECTTLQSIRVLGRAIAVVDESYLTRISRPPYGWKFDLYCSRHSSRVLLFGREAQRPHRHTPMSHPTR